jgi:hypothetical protein
VSPALRVTGEPRSIGAPLGVVIPEKQQAARCSRHEGMRQLTASLKRSRAARKRPLI